MIILSIFVVFAMSFEKTDVCNKILIDKFFRGIVADNLAEEISIVEEAGCVSQTYSQMRSCLIFWIEKNPKKACDLFEQYVKKNNRFVIKATLYEYYLNPEFKKLIDKMKTAAKDDVSYEEVREISSLLFDANFASEGGVVVGDISNSSKQSSGKEIDYYSVNHKALDDEVLMVKMAWEYLSKYKIKDLGDIIKKTDRYYLMFTNYASVLRNVKGVDEKNIKRLFSTISDLRRYLILKSLVVKLRLNENSFMKKTEFIEIYKSLENDTYLLSLSTKSYRDFVKDVFDLWGKIDEMSNLVSFVNERDEILSFFDFKYSCFMDYIFQFLAKQLLHLRFYSDVEKKINTIKDYFSKEDFANSYFDKYATMRSEFRKISEKLIYVSFSHRKIQYLFWDNLLPFDFYFRKENGYYFGIKVKEEGLF
ncbi:MAG: hypothetical protein ACP5IO_04065 [Elusimicrobiales bacterium]